MISKYEAHTVPILKFSHEVDSDGHIIPPECYVKALGKVPVVFNDEKQERVGTVLIYRQGDILYGDFKLRSVMSPVSDALSLMRNLIPGIGFEIHDSYSNIILMIKITHVLVTNSSNSNPGVGSFGDKIHCLSKGMLN